MRIFIATERMENFNIAEIKSDVGFIHPFKTLRFLWLYILNMSVYVQLEILTPKYCLSLLDISGSIYMFFYFMSQDLY